MNDKKITLEIEQLEERIAPSVAPGLDIQGGTGIPPGMSVFAFNVTGNPPGLGELWFGEASGQFGC